MSAGGKDSITLVSVDDVNQTSSVVGIPFLRGVRLCPLKFPCALLVFKHVMSSYVIVLQIFSPKQLSKSCLVIYFLNG